VDALVASLQTDDTYTIAAVQSEQTARANADSAMAGDITTLESSVVDALNSNGANKVAVEYSDFEGATLPAVHVINGSALRATGTFYSGASSLRIDATAAACECYLGTSDTDYNIPVDGSVTYYLTLRTRLATTNSPITGSQNAKIHVKWDDGTLGTLNLTLPTNNWQLQTLEVTSPSAAKSALIRIDNDSWSGGSETRLFIDEVMFERKTTGQTAPSPFVQGAVSSKAMESLTTTVATHDGQIAAINAEWSVSLSVGGKVAGVKLMNDGTVSKFDILASNFGVYDPLDPEKLILGTDAGITYIDGAYMKEASIDSVSIKLATITDAHIANLDAAKITTGYLSATRIAADTITGSHIASNTITATQIAANTITATQIATNTITASQIAANAITASELAANSITAAGGHIADLAVDTLQIQDNAVTVPTGVNATGTVAASSGEGDYVTIDTVTFDPQGGQVLVVYTCVLRVKDTGTGEPATPTGYVRILRDGNELTVRTIPEHGWRAFAITWIDTSTAAGSRTYKIEGKCTVNQYSGNTEFKTRSLACIGMRK
jgi:hypothetical protein